MQNSEFEYFSAFREAVLIARDGGLVYANPAAERLFGRAPHEVLEELCRLLPADGPLTEATLTLWDQPVTVSRAPLGGAVLYRVERERDEDEALPDLMRSLCGSLRSAASVQRLAAERMRQLLREAEDTRPLEPLSAVEHASFRVARDAENLQVLTGDDVPLPGSESECFDPALAAAELVDSIKAFLPGCDLRLRDRTKTPLILKGSRGDLDRALMNLISNSLKYSENGAPVWVGLSQRGDRLRITVEDSGCGIPPERLGEVFRSYRLPRPTRDPRAGLGLGLSAVRCLCARLGGLVLLESREGVGTTATLELPVKEGKALRDESAAYDRASRVLTVLADVLPTEQYREQFLD